MAYMRISVNDLSHQKSLDIYNKNHSRTRI